MAFDDALADGAVAADESGELRRLITELQRRMSTLYRGVGGWVGGPTADQQAQMRYFGELLDDIEARLGALGDAAQ